MFEQDSRSSVINPADFQSVRNDVYDVSAATQEVRGVSYRRQNNNHIEENSLPFPRRMALRVEGGSSEFNACGGFSGGAKGTCCKACMRLNYKQGCWCRTWDCLCFNS